MDYAAAVLFALTAWWFSTGAVLYLIGLPRQTHGLSMVSISAAAGLALLMLWTSSSDESVTGAFTAFTCALVVWAWHEMSFLMGFVTGPRTNALPAGASGRQRFILATQVLIYHELAITMTAAAIAAVTWGGANLTGLWTFLILWLARLSAKLNVFLGVPNLTEEFLPSHLVYLKTYFRRRGMNLLFPLSITVSTLATGMLIDSATRDGVTPFGVASLTLLSALMALVVIEHWFLVLPLPAARLWTWGLSSRTSGEENPVQPLRRNSDAPAGEPPFEACPRQATQNV